jgi:hypothetical protein
MERALLARFAIINVRADFDAIHSYIPDEGHEFDDEYSALFFTKRLILESAFLEENRYTPIEPKYSGRNEYFGRMIYRIYRDDPDLPILLKCVLPSKVVDIILSGFDLRKVEMILRGDYNFEVESDDDAFTLISLALSRKDLTKEQVRNVLKFAEMYINKAGSRDAMVGILQRFALGNKEVFSKCIGDIVREFPWIKDLVGR